MASASRPIRGARRRPRVVQHLLALPHAREEKETPFNRLHYDPSAFCHVCDEFTVTNVTKNKCFATRVDMPLRINLMMYVDDGRTFDNCAPVCDAFMTRFCDRFSISAVSYAFEQHASGLTL